MRTVPRHEFVPNDLLAQAYENHPLPIGYGQTISQPYIVAWMTELLELKPGEKVLEIGTGSGYQAAVLAELGYVDVYSIEIVPELADNAAHLLHELGYTRCAGQAGGWLLRLAGTGSLRRHHRHGCPGSPAGSFGRRSWPKAGGWSSRSVRRAGTSPFGNSLKQTGN